jgi:hypothetical protein
MQQIQVMLQLTHHNPSAVANRIFYKWNAVKSSCCCWSATHFTILPTGSSTLKFCIPFLYILSTHNISVITLEAGNEFLLPTCFLHSKTRLLNALHSWTTLSVEQPCLTDLYTISSRWQVNQNVVLPTTINKSIWHTYDKCSPSAARLYVL